MSKNQPSEQKPKSTPDRNLAPNLRKAKDGVTQFGERHPELLPDLDLLKGNADGSLASLKRLLAVAAEDDDKIVYSFLLQIWLLVQGIVAPQGIFNFEPSKRGRGRPRGRLGVKAYQSMLDNPTLSYGQIAQKVLPDEYLKDREKAAKRVRRSIESVLQKIGPKDASLSEVKEVISYAHRQMNAKSRQKR
ncbi:MAG: hypothetical protein O2968_11610 [Acidobacteria bacterium]|nr:hypothetical protein [Acidobacteriota bacterium]